MFEHGYKSSFHITISTSKKRGGEIIKDKGMTFKKTQLKNNFYHT
jgi:hypothetical protein